MALQLPAYSRSGSLTNSASSTADMDIDLYMLNTVSGLSISNDLSSTPSPPLEKVKKKPDMELISTKRRACKLHSRRIQKDLAAEVKKVQRNPDNALNDALAAFSLTPETTTTSDPKQPAAAAAPPRPGYYNHFGHFIQKPRVPRAACAQIKVASMGSNKAISRAVDCVTTQVERDNKPCLSDSNGDLQRRCKGKAKVGRRIPEYRMREASAFISCLGDQDIRPKLGEMRNLLGLPHLDTAGFTDSKVRKKISSIYSHWTTVQSRGQQGQDVSMEMTEVQGDDSVVQEMADMTL